MRKARLRALALVVLARVLVFACVGRNEKSPIKGIDTSSLTSPAFPKVCRNEKSPIKGIDTKS